MPAARPIDETVFAIRARPVAYVSADTLASLLDVSETTVWEWQRKGILPRAVKIGGATRWKWADVEARITGRADERDPILEAARAR
jgi:predicted DNA-binding transcriptional regulator AlpA